MKKLICPGINNIIPLAMEYRGQAESRHQTILRARELIALLESRQEDCYLITHGFYLRTLIRELKRQGYRIRKSSPLGISNLDRITAVR